LGGIGDVVRDELVRMNCTIPQVWHSQEQTNFVRGSFAAPGQVDWAALCSRNGESTIVIGWGGPIRCASEVAMSPDQIWLQGVGDGKVGFSRMIRQVGEQFIRRMREEFGGPPLPPLTHDGIDDYFVEKASQVHYCHNGKWLVLKGIDL
jgi:hypothetical protein